MIRGGVHIHAVIQNIILPFECFEKAVMFCYSKMLKCGALHDLVPFVQFKKREKHPWRSVNFSKVAGY